MLLLLTCSRRCHFWEGGKPDGPYEMCSNHPNLTRTDHDKSVSAEKITAKKPQPLGSGVNLLTSNRAECWGDGSNMHNIPYTAGIYSLALGANLTCGGKWRTCWRGVLWDELWPGVTTARRMYIDGPANINGCTLDVSYPKVNITIFSYAWWESDELWLCGGLVLGRHKSHKRPNDTFFTLCHPALFFFPPSTSSTVSMRQSEEQTRGRTTQVTLSLGQILPEGVADSFLWERLYFF